MDLNNQKIKNHTSLAGARSTFRRGGCSPKQWMANLANLLYLYYPTTAPWWDEKKKSRLATCSSRAYHPPGGR